MDIRSASPGDEAGIARVHAETYAQTYQGIIPDTLLWAVSVEKRTAFWREILTSIEQADSKTALFVAVKENVIRGFVSVSGSLQENPDPRGGEITAFYIEKAFQGQGIGKDLIHKALENLRSNHFEYAFVKVLDANPYKNFYAKSGGVFQADKTKSVKRGDQILELIEYRWSL